MNGYTKLFSSILDSTIWQEDLATKVLWVTMLAMSDYEGVVEGSIPGLARRAGISVGDCENSLAKLYAPDKYSRTPDHEGRRVAVIDGGWLILNRAKYRDKKWEDDKAERRREVNRRYYEKTKGKTDSDFKTSEISESDFVRDKKEKEKEKEKEESKSNTALRAFVPPTLDEVTAYCKERNSEVDPDKFHAYYTSQGWYVGKNRMKNWQAAVRTWERNNYGGEFRDGYQKTGRIERQQLGTQAQRALNNIRAAEAAFMGSDSGADSPGQEARPSGGNAPTLEGEIKKLSGGHRL